MQLHIINRSLQNKKDQLFATYEFCQYLKDRKLNESIDGFDLNVQLIPRKTEQEQ